MASTIPTNSYVVELLVGDEILLFDANEISTFDLPELEDPKSDPPLEETSDSDLLSHVFDDLPDGKEANSTTTQQVDVHGSMEENASPMMIMEEGIDNPKRPRMDIIPPGKRTLPLLFDHLREALEDQPTLDAPEAEWLSFAKTINAMGNLPYKRVTRAASRGEPFMASPDELAELRRSARHA